ncbi:1-phosphatidylinositol 4,5-bisphosphate phosphodiesterase 1 [Cercospora beticola]|uniref:Phosphoinositide phospholipase C n=1 Tax=Cercospora beticola TaxID=122368 RepID=A0A2G5I7J7_CERBT|nr:1-phosphatidylinositol 4,5-bisphosphate phosphodiesterase 1 [Cercospora beticola]PIB00771.1 1-phosphatidylinositol 4,5-bisphosphate phosphodiesterase 1 [Cercospora beticola]WPA96640.1 hypothetical protein RHO25_001247 [Cercospora beticola]CAK1355013.1 unnamed protein product [Cercospora beticola]
MASTAPAPAPLSPAITKRAAAIFQPSSQHATLDEFLAHLTTPQSSAALPIDVDTAHPLSHYFISSSHNTYLSGNQLWSKSSGDAYQQVLKLDCRCIEIDLWDGDSPSSSEAEDNAKKPDDVNKLSGLLKKKLNRLRSRSDPKADDDDQPKPDDLMPMPWRTASGRSEPVVYHGYTATKEVPFRKVCEVVRQYAFYRTTLPLIVSLEVHCSPPQQEIVCELMQDYWGEFLVKLPDGFSDSTPLPSLENLRKKILVKVKFVPPEKAKNKDANEDDSSEDEGDATKKSKIIEKLSTMGVFTRAFHFQSFDHPTSSIPTHVFSFGESKLLKACEEQPEQLLKHNQHYLMRAYPKGTRLRSTNLDPAPFWRYGVQMVALNFQKINAANMLNFAQFESTGGYVLKPHGYLPTGSGDGVQARRRSLDLSVKLHAAQALGTPKDVPKAYVKCELHVGSKDEFEKNKIAKGGKNKGGEWKHKSSVVESRDPEFDELLDFRGVHGIVPELSFFRLKVMDDVSYQKDDLLGWACYRLDRLPNGPILVHLRGEDYKPNGARLLLSVTSQWTE